MPTKLPSFSFTLLTQRLTAMAFAMGTVLGHGLAYAMRYQSGIVMPGKTPAPWYRESKKAWYVCIDGKQHALGKDRDEAFRRFHLLMAGEPVPTPNPKPMPTPEPTPKASVTLGQLADAYLIDAQRRLTATPYRVAKWMVEDFAVLFRRLDADAIRKHHVETWIGKHPSWGQSTENLAKGRIVAMFRWGVEQGLVSSNPIQGIKKPPIKGRGTEALVSADDHKRLMEAAYPALRDVLFALRESGARPSEVMTVEAKDFDADAGVWILPKHKTADKGKARIVFLTPELTALCSALAIKYPIGPLFRNAHGKPWHKISIAKRLRELRERLGIKGRVMPYGYRHSFATDALARGVPDAQVAALLRHSGAAMRHRHYSHLTERSQALRQALAQVR